MNGILNAIFIVVLFMFMVAFAYIFSISDILMDEVYAQVNAITPNATSTEIYNDYGSLRDLLFNVLNHALLPFLIFMAFFSSFVNRNQSPIQYVVSAMGVILLTPMLVYLFAEVITNMTNISIIDTDYIFSTYTANFTWILVANMLLALASYVFVRKQVSYA